MYDPSVRDMVAHTQCVAIRRVLGVRTVRGRQRPTEHTTHIIIIIVIIIIVKATRGGTR